MLRETMAGAGIAASFLMALFVAGVFAQQETPEQIQRMLDAFRNPASNQGMIVVSFETVTREEAEGILASYGLRISTSRVCGPEIQGPGTQPSPPQPPQCREVVNWNGLLSVAEVEVPEGQGAAFAARLILHEKIGWVEPKAVHTIAGGQQETSEQRRQRMRAQFNIPGYTPGMLHVSFESSVSQEEASAILRGFGLEISTSEVCGPETADPPPGSPPSQPSQATCRMVVNWNEAVNSALVEVPAGQELAFAEQLYGHEKIAWTGPDYFAVIEQGSQGSASQTAGGGLPAATAALLVVVAAIIVFAMALRRKK